MARTRQDVSADLRVLQRFLPTYRRFWETDDEEERRGLRGKLNADLVAADRAMTNAGVTFGVAPPPAIGGPARHGLLGVAFAEEDPVFARAEGHIRGSVIDYLEQAIGALKNELRTAPRRARDPADTRAVGPASVGSWGRLRALVEATPWWVRLIGAVVVIAGVVIGALADVASLFGD